MRGIPRSAWLLAALSGVLQVLIFPSPSLYFLCWIALTPLLVAILRTPGGSQVQVVDASGRELLAIGRGQAFLLGYFSGLLFYLGSYFWIYYVLSVYGGLSKPVAAVVLLLFCLYLSVYQAFFGFFLVLAARRRSGPASLGRALGFAPFIWVAIELARTRITGFPWNLVGYSQVDNIPLTSITTVTGVYGVSFAVLLVNAAFAAMFLVEHSRRRSMGLAAVAAAVVLQLGMLVRPAPAPATHSARLVQQSIPILYGEEWTFEYFTRTLAELAQLSTAGETMSAPPRLVVWPESPAPFYITDPNFSNQVSGVARRAQAYVIAGSLGVRTLAERRDPQEIMNSAALVSPSGEWFARYDKIHLVPFGEYVPFKSILVFAEKITREAGNFGRGTTREVFPLDGHKVGVFICYESIFPDEVREFAAKGGEVFVNISNDGWFGYYGAPEQHLNMARMRAVENRRWLLRATNTGITASIDPYGRVVAEAPRDTRAYLDAPYGFRSDTTFYTRHGDWFAYGCAIIALIGMLVRFRLRAGVLSKW